MDKKEHHKVHRSGRMRAAVLGANDGIISVASLMLGVIAAGVSPAGIIVAGIASLVAGAISMAAGEYVSVCSQADIEKADLDMEKQALEDHYDEELQELAHIYIERGLSKALSVQVASALMKHDALDAHARDELGISPNLHAQPIQAAFYSFVSFSIGAVIPLTVVVFAPEPNLTLFVAIISVLFLGVLGAGSAFLGGASMTKAALRVAIWGAAAMLMTSLLGQFFDIDF